MRNVAESPFSVFFISVFVLWVSVRVGSLFHAKKAVKEEDRQDYDVVLTAILTLLGLIIGFSFAMVITRYDQRKNYEEAEANAIGTEYARADLLPAEDGARVRELLKNYTDQRVLFYETRDRDQLARIDAQTAKLQSDLWSVVKSAAAKQPTPTVALVASGMNDVLNSQGYTQAAWWNRFPVAAWGLLAVIAIFCSILFGYVSHGGGVVLSLLLPFAVSTSFFLIADISSPRHGFIRVIPQNLVTLSQSFRAR